MNEVDNWCNFTICFSSTQWQICLFFVSHLWTIKLTGSKKYFFCISGRVTCTIKLNIKETLQKDGFLQKFMSWMDCSQITKHLLLDNILFNEGREDSCYSLPTLGNPWTFFKQGLAYKVLLSTMTTGVTLLLLSAVDNDTFFLFLMSQVLTMKLTELTNICYISDRVACTIKQNIKETFLENNGFARI